MTWTTIQKIGDYGIIYDTPAHLTPIGAWSDANNVGFRNGRVFKSRGTQKRYPQVTSGAIWGINQVVDIQSYWIYADTDDLFVVSGNVAPASITRDSAQGGNYSTSRNGLWNGGNLSGITVLNNGADIPQTFRPGVDSQAQNLENWPPDLRCDIMAVFGYFLVACNLKDGTDPRRPNRVRWSHPALPGRLPISWAIDDPTVESGETDLPDRRPGDIVDAVVLRDWLLLYERNAIWGMRFVGGNEVFSFTNLFPTLGAMTTNCVAAFDHRGGQYHCVFTGDNVIVHDGRSIHNSLDKKVVRQIARELSESNWRRSFVVNMPSLNENWICYPVGGSSSPNRAMVWNYLDNTVSPIDLYNVNWISLGIVSDTVDRGSWDSFPAGEIWDDQALAWGASTEEQQNIRPLGFSEDVNNTIRQMGTTTSVNGEPTSEVLEKRDIAIVPNRQTRDPIRDYESRKQLKAIRFESSGVPLNISIAATENIGEEPNYGNPHVIKAREDESFQFLDNELHEIVEGRAFHMKIEVSGRGHWELHGFSMDIERIGDY